MPISKEKKKIVERIVSSKTVVAETINVDGGLHIHGADEIL